MWHKTDNRQSQVMKIVTLTVLMVKKLQLFPFAQRGIGLSVCVCVWEQTEGPL